MGWIFAAGELQAFDLGNRKIPRSHGSSKRADVVGVPPAVNSLTTPSKAATTAAPLGPAISGPATTGVAAQSNFDLSMMAQLLSAIAGAAGISGNPNAPVVNPMGSGLAGRSGGAPIDSTYAPLPSVQGKVPDWYNEEASLSAGGPGSANCGLTQSTLITHYGADPSQYKSARQALMEGGAIDRYGQKLNSVEQSIKNGRPVSLAGDTQGQFGSRCNTSPSRSCLMLVCYDNFDQTFPEYRSRFPGVQKNCLIGVVVDTGGAFTGTSGRKIDVAVNDIKKAETLSADGRYFEIEASNCKAGADKRACPVNSLMATCVPAGTSSAPGVKINKTQGVQ
jgi:hypothetical protein